MLNYPIRINHYLAAKGYCSRREADRLIERGLVNINGQKALIGQKVNEHDVVEVNQATAQQISKDRVYLAFYKPEGLATQDIPASYKFPKKVFPIGRLDRESHGLIILTNDGRITDKLLNPEFDHKKEYVVRVDKTLRPFFLRHLEGGVDIEGYQTKPAKVEKINDNTFRIVLTEGKTHQIRRMAAAFDYAVRDLKRERIMNLKLGSLSPGQWRQIKGPELVTFLQTLGV